MTLDDIERLCGAARRAGITTLEWADRDGTFLLRLETPDAATVAGSTQDRTRRSDAGSRRDIGSPAVGRFRQRHPATGRPVADPGARVEAGHIVGFVEAGVMLHPVVAPAAGTLGAPVCPDGAPVGYGAPLFGFT